MAIKGAFTFAEWVARLTRGYIKATGKEPDNLAKLKINMEAGQRVKDQSKVVKGDFNPNEKWWEARTPKVTAKEATPIKKTLSDDQATFQIQQLQTELPHMKRMEVLQLMDDITAKKSYGAFDDVQRKQLLDAISEVYTRKPDFASGGIAGELHLNRPGYFLGNLVKLLRGGKNVYRGTSTGGGVGGHFVPESKKFLKGKYYTTDKKEAEMYAELGKGILGIKKLTLSKKEFEKAKRIGQKFHEEIILPKKLAKKAEIDIPSSIKVNVKKIIKDIREGNAKGGIAGQLHLNQGGRARFQDGLSAYQEGMQLMGPSNLRNYPGGDREEVWDPYSGSWTSYGYDTEGAAAARSQIAGKLGERGKDYLSQYDPDFDIDAMRDPFQPYEGIVPGFTAKKRADDKYEYKHMATGDIYGPDTYTNIAAGWYPDIYDPNKASTPVAEDTGLASTVFPEGEFQDIRATSKTPTEYNIRATKDLVENLPGGVVRDVLAPAAAGVMSLPYDAMQAMTRTSEADVARAMETAGMYGPKDIAAEAFGTAYARERPLSTAMERMTGAAAPLAERMQAAQAKGYDPRMGRTYAENIQAMADPRMRGAKGGLAKVLGV